MTDSFGFNSEERYANRIEPVKEELASAVNDPEDMMLIIMEALNEVQRQYRISFSIKMVKIII